MVITVGLPSLSPEQKSTLKMFPWQPQRLFIKKKEGVEKEKKEEEEEKGWGGEDRWWQDSHI